MKESERDVYERRHHTRLRQGGNGRRRRIRYPHPVAGRLPMHMNMQHTPGGGLNTRS